MQADKPVKTIPCDPFVRRVDCWPLAFIIIIIIIIYRVVKYENGHPLCNVRGWSVGVFGGWLAGVCSGHAVPQYFDCGRFNHSVSGRGIGSCVRHTGTECHTHTVTAYAASIEKLLLTCS